MLFFREVVQAGYASDPFFLNIESRAKLLDPEKHGVREEDGLYYQGERLVVPASLMTTFLRLP